MSDGAPYFLVMVLECWWLGGGQNGRGGGGHVGGGLAGVVVRR